MRKVWIKEKDSNDNVVAVLKNFIYQSGIKVTNSTIEQELKLHSHYHCIQSISDLLYEWLIPNGLYKIQLNKLPEAVFPGICYLTTQNKFVLVVSCKNDYVKYIDTQKGWQTELMEDFCRKWDGVILMAQINDNSGEENYKENRHSEVVDLLLRNFGIVLIIILVSPLLLTKFKQGQLDLNLIIVLIIKYIGLIISIMLLLIKNNSGSAFLERICNLHDKLSCKGVNAPLLLSSFIKWDLAEVGFFYFFVSLSSLVIWSSPDHDILGVFSLISIFAGILSIYLILYQFIKLKKLCPFCLVVQVVLQIELLFSFRTLKNFEPTIDLLFKIGYILIIATIGYIILNILSRSFKLRSNFVSSQMSLNRIIQNTTLIDTILLNQKPLSEPQFELDFIIKESSSDNMIVFVLSLNCKYCKKVLREIQKVLYANLNMKVCIRFSINNEEEEEIAERIFVYYFEGEKEMALEAISSWYNITYKESEIQRWKDKYPKIGNQTTKALVRDCNEWIVQNSIYGTPSIIINGKVLPSYLNPYSFTYLYRHFNNKKTLKKSVSSFVN